MTSIRFDQQVAVVTGAGGGLGRTYALELAARGAAVVVNDLGGNISGDGAGTSMADSVVAEILAAGGKAVANYDSVADSKGADAIIQTALDKFGRVDIVINNAGNLRNAYIDKLSDDDIDSLHSVHLKGSLYVSRAAFHHMKQQGYGRILFTSSAAGVFGNPEQAAYAAAKAGMVGLTNVFGIEGEAHGIKTNTLLPMAASRMAEKMDPAQLQQFAELNATFGNALTPDYITPLVVYLVSRECEANKSIYSAVAGRFAKVVIGLTKGWLGPRDAPASVEDVAAHFADIEDQTVVDEPCSLVDELQIIAKHVRAE
ncbi:SDR family NAD(P)-dependent oxidoreductase [Spongiibacter sp. KMU-166]|uniref:SDR family NAD(P)-dependent oxidoreductase n=1 Tax=Spongiibacter thalassae TaxID=2721624 RepID=A0ABX1GA02_9GAMM|nr:SDR family NAD(P)-dependent oxidoreductase [Spongiibacter thalassae]NKI15989.1 SDR family NAD(P)-dependent oxidoreductase [Spongiibacter thalassae]